MACDHPFNVSKMCSRYPASFSCQKLPKVVYRVRYCTSCDIELLLDWEKRRCEFSSVIRSSCVYVSSGHFQHMFCLFYLAFLSKYLCAIADVQRWVERHCVLLQREGWTHLRGLGWGSPLPAWGFAIQPKVTYISPLIWRLFSWVFWIPKNWSYHGKIEVVSLSTDVVCALHDHTGFASRFFSGHVVVFLVFVQFTDIFSISEDGGGWLLVLCK